MGVCTFTDFGAGRRHRFCLPLARLSWPPMAAATLSQLALGGASGRSGLARSWARRALPPNEIPSRNTSWIFSEYCCGFQAGKFVCLFGESCKDMPMTRKSAVYSKNQANLKKHLKKPVFILGSLGSTGPLNVDAERRKMPCAMRAGAVIYSSVFRARC